MFFKFRFKVLGGHTHISMFAGNNTFSLGKCGDLCMRNHEFQYFRDALTIVFKEDCEFVDETVLETASALPSASPVGDSPGADVRVSPQGRQELTGRRAEALGGCFPWSLFPFSSKQSSKFFNS